MSKKSFLTLVSFLFATIAFAEVQTTCNQEVVEKLKTGLSYFVKLDQNVGSLMANELYTGHYFVLRGTGYFQTIGKRSNSNEIDLETTNNFYSNANVNSCEISLWGGVFVVDGAEGTWMNPTKLKLKSNESITGGLYFFNRTGGIRPGPLM